MTRPELAELTARLSGVLTGIDAAVRARFSDAPPRREVTRRRHAATRRRDGLRGMAAATLRWLAGSATGGRRPRGRA
jgi:hypothetical protein